MIRVDELINFETGKKIIKEQKMLDKNSKKSLKTTSHMEILLNEVDFEKNFTKPTIAKSEVTEFGHTVHLKPSKKHADNNYEIDYLVILINNFDR